MDFYTEIYAVFMHNNIFMLQISVLFQITFLHSWRPYSSVVLINTNRFSYF